jgi:S-(hydroxymethyl)glutathione dehydrogenase/alcohol dehydrogenase
MKSLAAILVESNAPLVLDEIEFPALQTGQVLVRIHRSGVCGAQLNEIGAIKGPDKFLPHLLGHEGGGIVEDIGPGVTHVKPGDRVVLHWRKGAGIHAAPASYLWNGKKVNSGWVTTFSYHSIVSENRVTKIADSADFEVAALMGCAVTTALGLINNDAKIKIGQSVAVLGCGGVGMSVVQAAALGGGNPIIAIDRVGSKLEAARHFGATHTIDTSSADLSAAIRDIVGPEGVDIFVETTGNVRLIEAAYRLTGNKGHTVMVGVPRHDQDITIHSLPLHFGKVLTGCEGGQTDPTLDIPRYMRLVDSGKLRVKDLITHRLPLERVNEAIELMKTGQAGRCMLEMP